jgi:hypothetical protein
MFQRLAEAMEKIGVAVIKPKIVTRGVAAA